MVYSTLLVPKRSSAVLPCFVNIRTDTGTPSQSREPDTYTEDYGDTQYYFILINWYNYVTVNIM